jgi:hypothetical protein
VALDRQTFADNADKSVVTARDAISHRPTTMDFRDKTLGTAMPGDIVDVDGEEQVLTAVDHRAVGAAFAMDPRTLEENADKTKLTVKGAVDHQPLEIDLGARKISELKPGDEIAVNGEPHTLWGVEKTGAGTLYLADRKTKETVGSEQGSLVSGIAFSMATFFKFHQHKLNPSGEGG